MVELSPKELKAVANAGLKMNYKGMPKDELLSALISSKAVRTVKSQK